MAKPSPRAIQQIFPTEDQIAIRAYELYLLDRDPNRAIADYWRPAETELLDRAARKALGVPDLKPKKP